MTENTEKVLELRECDPRKVEAKNFDFETYGRAAQLYCYEMRFSQSHVFLRVPGPACHDCAGLTRSWRRCPT